MAKAIAKPTEVKEPEIKVRDNRAIRKELAELQSEHAEKLLTAEAVVKRAQDPDSSLHTAGPFMWDDDDKAAHQWRLHVARSIIRKIEVVLPDDGTETMLPKYISLRPDRKRSGGGYRETAQILNNSELLAELEQTAKKDIEGTLRRYEMLKDFCSRVRAALKGKP